MAPSNSAMATGVQAMELSPRDKAAPQSSPTCAGCTPERSQSQADRAWAEVQLWGGWSAKHLRRGATSDLTCRMCVRAQMLREPDIARHHRMCASQKTLKG